MKRTTTLAILLALITATGTLHAGDKARNHFKRDVDGAIDRGVSFLYGLMENGLPSTRITNTYPMGSRALPVYALLESGTPTDAPLVGYDGATCASFVKVPGTPMVAIVAGGEVVTFLSADSAQARIALRGYGPGDFAPQ